MDPNQYQQPPAPQDPQQPYTPNPAPAPSQPFAAPSIVPQPFSAPAQFTAPTPQPTFGTENQQPQPASFQQPQMNAQPGPYMQPMPQQQQQGFYPNPGPSSGMGGNSRMKLILAGAGGLVILVGLIVGFLVFGGDDKSGNTADADNKSTSDDTAGNEETDSESNDNETAQNQDDAPTSKPVTVNKGFSVSAAGGQLAFDIKVINYELGVVGMSGGFEQKPYDEDMQYVMVKFSVKNKGDDSDDIYTSAVSLTDDKGKSYGQSFAYYSLNEADWDNRGYYETAGSIPVGKTKTGHLLFEVPKTAKKLDFTFDWKVDVIGGTDVDQVKKVKLF